MNLPRTDYGNAERLVTVHGKDIRFIQGRGWYAWDGMRWARDTTGMVMRHAKSITVQMLRAASFLPDDAQRALQRHALDSQSVARLKAMVTLAESEPGVSVDISRFDANPWLFNVKNGTLDLRTGECRAHDRNDYITKLSNITYDPDAKCERWISFLRRIMANKDSVIDFLQRAIGYTLTGSVEEEVFFILHGHMGQNGKSKFVDTITSLLGDYAKTAPPNLIIAKRNETHPTERADLQGARFVPAQETGDNDDLDEDLVKLLTGGDRIKAREMRQDFFEFAPTHKLWVATNHRPRIRSDSPAIWRRVLLIPFEVRIPEEERDKKLIDKLREELPGILNWALQGLAAWREKELAPPPLVLQAVTAYREAEDKIGNFLRDECMEAPGVRIPVAGLYDAYSSWCEEGGEKPGSKRLFSLRLQERGIIVTKGGKGTRIVIGWVLQPPTIAGVGGSNSLEEVGIKPAPPLDNFVGVADSGQFPDSFSFGSPVFKPDFLSATQSRSESNDIEVLEVDRPKNGQKRVVEDPQKVADKPERVADSPPKVVEKSKRVALKSGQTTFGRHPRCGGCGRNVPCCVYDFNRGLPFCYECVTQPRSST